MLPAENRLKKRKDFEYVFKRGKGFEEEVLILKIVDNNLENPRFGFVVSQKVSKKAVVRNKIKRRLREIVRKRLPSIKKKVDGVLIARPGIERKTFVELEKIVENLFNEAKLFDEKRSS